MLSSLGPRAAVLGRSATGGVCGWLRLVGVPMTQPERADELPDLEALRAAGLGLPASKVEQDALWHVCTDPVQMLDLLEPAFADEVVSERKIRLFVCACCRRVWHQLSAETQQTHVEVTERYVDGRATRGEFSVADWGREKPTESSIAACCRWDFDPYGGLYYLLHELQAALRQDQLGAAEAAARAALLRDIFRVPYPRPTTFEVAWKTSAVVGLAQAIYEDRAFDRLPILADALQDAGCDDDELLSHCRGPGPHVRGCWVVDLALGKE